MKAPLTPVLGQVFRVERGPGFADEHQIVGVSKRSFFVRHQSRRLRFALGDWFDWLRARTAEGRLELDGEPVDPPAGGVGRPAEVSVDLGARDQRFFRGVREVIGRYELRREDREALVEFAVRGGAEEYRVIVDRGWVRGPRCSCPDATSGGAPRGYCKHVIAALVSNPDLRHQLLTVLL